MVPKMLIYRYVVIYGILINVTIQEIEDNVECDFPVIIIQRLTKKIQSDANESTLVNTKLVELTLESQVLTEYISVYMECF